MKKQEYKVPQKGAVKRLRELLNEERKKRKPSDALMEILKEKPKKKINPPKAAKPSKKTPDAEL